MGIMILDVDTGEDDALAIALAVRTGLPVKYIVSSYGNTTLENATANSAGVLQLLNATSIKIVKGSSWSTKRHRQNWQGKSTG